MGNQGSTPPAEPRGSSGPWAPIQAGEHRWERGPPTHPHHPSSAADKPWATGRNILMSRYCATAASVLPPHNNRSPVHAFNGPWALGSPLGIFRGTPRGIPRGVPLGGPLGGVWGACGRGCGGVGCGIMAWVIWIIMEPFCGVDDSLFAKCYVIPWCSLPTTLPRNARNSTSCHHMLLKLVRI